MMIPKHKYVRSPALLKAAREIPCQHCGCDDGTVVAAHTNWGGHKGRSVKADDNMIASLCHTCHFAIDQGTRMSREEKMTMWQNAHTKTIEKLEQLGLYPKNVPKPY